jgi:ribonuclease P protein component
VVRNRIKRCLREFFRHRRHELDKGVDVLVIARKSAAELSFHHIAAEMSRSLIERGGQRR